MIPRLPPLSERPDSDATATATETFEDADVDRGATAEPRGADPQPAPRGGDRPRRSDPKGLVRPRIAPPPALKPPRPTETGSVGGGVTQSKRSSLLIFAISSSVGRTFHSSNDVTYATPRASDLSSRRPRGRRDGVSNAQLPRDSGLEHSSSRLSSLRTGSPPHTDGAAERSRSRARRPSQRRKPWIRSRSTP